MRFFHDLKPYTPCLVFFFSSTYVVIAVITEVMMFGENFTKVVNSSPPRLAPHHDRPRLPWCDEVDIEVVVAAAVESTPTPAASTPTPAAPVSSYNHCGSCKYSRSGDVFTELGQTTCTVPAGSEQCTVPVGSPNAGDICWSGNDEFMGAKACWVISVNYCAEDCTNEQGSGGNNPALAQGETCRPDVTNDYRCETEDGVMCYKQGSQPGNWAACRNRFPHGCADMRLF